MSQKAGKTYPGRDILWQWERIGCKFNSRKCGLTNRVCSRRKKKQVCLKWKEDHQSTTIIASEQVLLRVRISYIYILYIIYRCRTACLRNVSGECQLTEVSGCQPNMWESPKVRNFPVTKWFLGPAPLIVLKAGSIGRLCVCVAT